MTENKDNKSDTQHLRSVYQGIYQNISTVIKGQDKAIRLLLAGFISEGHILLEDYPGTGKTTLAKALARTTDIGFKRIQFTPDLLPSDILGVSIFNQQENVFRIHKGPIFTNILLADEINRASPRTQSALLEAMAESQVSIDGKIHHLDDLFFVIATQNPVESRGTYPLPEAQMDRFALQFDLGYVSNTDEIAILSDQAQAHPIDKLTANTTKMDILNLKNHIKNIQVSDAIKKYIVRIVSQTRSMQGVQIGASPRASLALMNTTKALAFFDDLNYVLPEHVQEIAGSVIAHRLVLDPQAQFSGLTAQAIVADILKDLEVPI